MALSNACMHARTCSQAGMSVSLVSVITVRKRRQPVLRVR